MIQCDLRDLISKLDHKLADEFAEIWDLISKLVSRSRFQDDFILRLVDCSLQSMPLAGAKAIPIRGSLLLLLKGVR